MFLPKKAKICDILCPAPKLKKKWKITSLEGQEMPIKCDKPKAGSKYAICMGPFLKMSKHVILMGPYPRGLIFSMYMIPSLEII